MKKIYMSPVVEIQEFTISDVIRTSSTTPGQGGTDTEVTTPYYAEF